MDIHRCRFVDYTPEGVTALAFSHRPVAGGNTPKNLRLAVGRADGSIEVWNPRNSRAKWLKVKDIYGGKGQSVEGLVWSLADSSEQPRLFSIGGSTYLTEWDLDKGTPVVNHDCNAGVIWSCAMNASQNRIAVGCDDGSVVVVNIEGGRGVIEHEAILQRQQSRVLSLCWIGDEMVIGGCADGRIRCWSYSAEETNAAAKGRLIQTLRVDKSKTESTLVWSLLALPKSGQFVSGDSTGSVKVWDLKHLVLQQSFSVHDADVLCLTDNATGDKFFSAGVDRKILSFTLTKVSKTSSKWVNSSNRLLHGNDIRAMASYVSKSTDYLVSGGVERLVLVNSTENFQTSIAIKLPLNMLERNVVVNDAKRLIVMWQAQQIKIWRLEADRSKRLVAKMTLSDPDNITSCSLSANGRYLVVSRLFTTKLFELIELEKKIQVVKVPSEVLASLGARIVRFVDKQKLILMVDDENDISSVSFNTEDDEDDETNVEEFDDEQQPTSYEMPTEGENYTQVAVSGTQVALSSLEGSIDLIDTKTGASRRLVHVNDTPTAINFTPRGTLLVVTMAPKVYEFNVRAKGVNLYTGWSKQNSEMMPPQFTSLPGQSYGVFENMNRFWVWGSGWVCFFDSSADFTLNGKQGKKRSANGSFIAADETVDEDTDDRSFWQTTNYKSLLMVDRLSDDELVIVERPAEDMPSTPAFRTSRIAGL